jgi:hypothetical protein
MHETLKGHIFLRNMCFFFKKENTYIIERGIFLKGKRERLDTKKGHMAKDRMAIRHQLRW